MSMYAPIGTMLLILVVPATFPGLLCVQAKALSPVSLELEANSALHAVPALICLETLSLVL